MTVPNVHAMKQAQEHAVREVREIGRRIKATSSSFTIRSFNRLNSDWIPGEPALNSPVSTKRTYFPHFRYGSNETEDNASRYERRRTIGHGGFGEVYEAYDTVDCELVAIKQVQWSTLFNLRKDKVAHRELDLLRTFQHRYIVVYKDAFIDNGLYSSDLLLVMELCERDLYTIIHCTKMKIDVCTAVNFMACISSAIEYLHSKQVIHRDVKPQNVLMTKDGTPKVTDFGLACFAGAEAENFNKMRRTIAGTPQYAAPELMSGLYDGSVDIWGLGCIFYELLTRRCFDRTRVALNCSDRAKIPHKLRAQLIVMLSEIPAHRPSAQQCAVFFDSQEQVRPPTTPQSYYWVVAIALLTIYILYLLLL